MDIAVENIKAHCVTLLRLAMHAESEHPGNALEDESFASALKEFSENVELMMAEDLPSPKGKWARGDPKRVKKERHRKGKSKEKSCDEELDALRNKPLPTPPNK